MKFGIGIMLLASLSVPFAAEQTPVPPKPAVTNELREPTVFASSNGALDLLMVAKPAPVSLEELKPMAWVYEVCRRKTAKNDSCPANSGVVSEYGGVRLQLQAGDHLKIRLVNQLPPAPPDAIHAIEDPAMLAANPTNLHTHGMIVEPRRADAAHPTYGDYVYVLGYPPGKKPKMNMPSMDMTDRPIDYDVYIPPNHASGLFWFHPHSHGLALNQVAHGMAGIITIGAPSDYLKLTGQQVRHLILKDMEVMKDGRVLSQVDSRFCETFAFPKEPTRNGSCPGALQNSGVDYRGGKWFFTINGQVFPTITIGDHGDLWRITNASGSATYLLKLIDDATGKPIPFQVMWTDGVSRAVPNGEPIEGMDDEAIPRETCETASSPSPGKQAICTSQLLVMPSSRVEIFVPARVGNTQTATLTQASYGTGVAGNAWPFVKLAHVVFDSAATNSAASKAARSPKAKSAKAEASPKPPDTAPSPPLGKVAENENCAALPPGHRRRIFFGIPASAAPNNGHGVPGVGQHGLGYEEIDAKGNAVAGTFHDIARFDHHTISVCLPLAEENRPVTEEWELINVSGEDHNFHMHQTRFKVLADAGGGNVGLFMDSIPMPHGSFGCTGTVARWRRGACRVKPIVVSIQFSQLGDFVYHCHILEHEDAGMMAHIRVIPHK